MNALAKTTALEGNIGSSGKYEKRIQFWKQFSHTLKESMLSMDTALRLTDRKVSGEKDIDVHIDIRNILNRIHGSISDLQEFLSTVISLEDKREVYMQRKPLHKIQGIINPELNELTNKDKEPERSIYARMISVRSKKSLNMIKDVIHPVLKEIHDKNKEHKNHIVTKMSSVRVEEAWIVGNQFLLKSVLRNLIQNAIRHNYEGSNIFVGVKKNGPFLNVNVMNSGKTIARRQIFLRPDSSCF